MLFQRTNHQSRDQFRCTFLRIQRVRVTLASHVTIIVVVVVVVWDHVSQIWCYFCYRSSLSDPFLSLP